MKVITSGKYGLWMPLNFRFIGEIITRAIAVSCYEIKNKKLHYGILLITSKNVFLIVSDYTLTNTFLLPKCYDYLKLESSDNIEVYPPGTIDFNSILKGTQWLEKFFLFIPKIETIVVNKEYVIFPGIFYGQARSILDLFSIMIFPNEHYKTKTSNLAEEMANKIKCLKVTTQLARNHGISGLFFYLDCFIPWIAILAFILFK
jgi:hypothetical protein